MTESALTVRNLFVSRGGRPVLRDDPVVRRAYLGRE
jgi:hypothetical protein